MKVKTYNKYEEMWSKIRDLIRSITNNSDDDYDEKYMKSKFNSDKDLPLNKMLLLDLYFMKIELLLTRFLRRILVEIT